MDTFEKLLAVPSWAVDFCPIYLIVAAVSVLGNLAVLASLLFIGPAAREALAATLKMSLVGVVVALLLNSVVIGFMGSLQFWVCKSALSHSQVKEAFSVKCKSTEDCTAVAGTPQGPTCTCGARGLCGSCIQQNNMEPSLFSGSDSDLMPFEGFGNYESFATATYSGNPATGGGITLSKIGSASVNAGDASAVNALGKSVPVGSKGPTVNAAGVVGR
jgi:hypothetical protein